ncbi:hypothetical protein FDB14_17440 [Clostridium botulinum]|uniref:Uncharacterized protein n=1 Tax=Clostridium botulinum TaxID=1491 RepID=A0A140B465_CLOBO|nr:hypothetical protein [Clostridium botulinum]ALP69031.1 L-tyrosine decarboxylase domain-containing hypothetical protein [Clostridium botulinum]MBY7043762.1 hypothetical protein [Clostridium botulinum]NFK66339.1 hypothetical protein [Clostridium botulinum]NFK69444.1 hypothetical protein [Clostridium botulinum]NFK97948.1 hypothetical protein [Clostridium botulinum]
MNSNIFICELSKENQDKIKKSVLKYLIKEGYNINQIKETLTSVMENRLWLVEEIIDINQLKV